MTVTELTKKESKVVKKQICKIFRDNGLKITIEANTKEVDFLDVTLSLKDESFRPYCKPNNIPSYINVKSNHPPDIVNNIAKRVNKRLSSLSSSKEIFEAAAPPYQEALNKSGHTYKLEFEQPNPSSQPKRKNRPRKVVWFNPPYNEGVKTKIGWEFLNIIDSCFPPGHPLRKIINRSNVKISYSCMPNMKKNKIKEHNKKILKREETKDLPEESKCNCQKSRICPLDKKCQTNDLVYGAELRESNGTIHTYVGSTTNFKKRFRNHKSSFKLLQHEHRTTLSKKYGN